MTRHVSHIKAIFLLSVVAAVISISCQRRPLELYYTAGAKVLVKVDWTKYTERPTGMTLMFYDQYGSNTRITSSNVDSAYVTLEVGDYDVFVFNQSETEFGSISFSGMERFDTPEAIVEEIASKWYKSKADDEYIGTNPDDLGVAVGHFKITEEMVKEYNEYYTKTKTKTKTKNGTKADAGEEDLPDFLENSLITLYPTNITSILNVTAYITGIDNLYSARASLTGLAKGYKLTQLTPSSTDVTQLLDQWEKVKYEGDDAGKGYLRLRSDITTFGLPGGYEGIDLTKREPALNVFTLSILLRDGKTVLDFPFNVGHHFVIEKDTETGVAIRVKLILEVGNRPGEEIKLPDVDPADSDNGGGFTADVDDWDEEINADIPL